MNSARLQTVLQVCHLDLQSDTGLFPGHDDSSTESNLRLVRGPESVCRLPAEMSSVQALMYLALRGPDVCVVGVPQPG